MPEVEPSERKPQLQEVLARARAAAASGLFVALPAAVTKYDPATRKVDVQVLIKDAYLDESGDRQVVSLGVVPSCPVRWPAYYSEPISDGTLVFGGKLRPATIGFLTFCDRSMDKWLSGNGQEVDPEIDHEHDVTDGVFEPGLWPFGKAPPAPQDAIVIGDAQGADWAALAGLTHDTLSRLQVALDVLFSPASTIIMEAGNGTPSALQAALIAALGPKPTGAGITGPGADWPDSVAAEQVKLK